MKNKNICLFNTAIPWGGGEKWYSETAQHLHQSGHNVFVMCQKNSQLKKSLESCGIRTIDVSAKNTSFLNFFKINQIRSRLREEECDVIILNLSRDLKLGGLAAKWAGVKKIIYTRGIDVPVKNSFTNRFIFKKIVTNVLANSLATSNALLARNNKLIEKSKIKIIPHGIDIQNFIKKPSKPYYIAKKNEFVVTSLGRLEKEKNQQFLLKAASELKKRGVNFKMIIGGVGSLEEELKETALSEQLTHEIIFVGFVKNAKDLYDSGDVFLLPSVSEGFGFVKIEANLAGKPVIAFDISSNPETINNNYNGILVKFGHVSAFCDAIQKLSEDKKMLREMSKNSIEYVKKNYDINSINKQIETFITDGLKP